MRKVSNGLFLMKRLAIMSTELRSSDHDKKDDNIEF